MNEEYRFKEVRKGERSSVLAFARKNGCMATRSQLRHHMSLAVEKDGEIVAVALCLEQQQGQSTIQIVSAKDSADEGLIQELTDRCLRKVQSGDIAAARLQSPCEASAENIWTNANWLDKIKETAPPNTHPPTEPDTTDAPDEPEASQAA